MPNVTQATIDSWRERVEIDYYTHFIKAYIVFNAWYRKEFGDGDERMVIDSVKNDTTNRNHLRRAILGKFTSVSPEAEEFRAAVGSLHRGLTSFALRNSKGWPVSFTEVFVTYNRRKRLEELYGGIKYLVNLGDATAIHVEVFNTAGDSIFKVIQAEYDWQSVTVSPNFTGLSAPQQSRLQYYYRTLSPIVTEDLTNLSGGSIQCGGEQLCANPAYLFSGLVEIIYDLRNLLFHGEIIPTSEIDAIYQAAYNVLLRFIKSIP